MALEDSIYGRLTANADLIAQLTTWMQTPAVFRIAAPPDTDPGWEKDANGNLIQYPRVIYLLDLQTNTGGVPVGLLHVQVEARDLSGAPTIEDVLPVLHNALDGSALYSPDVGLAVFQEIGRSPIPSTAERVVGIDVLFRVQVYPPNLTYPPDPVATMNRFSIQYLDPRITIAPQAWDPQDPMPALYWRVPRRASDQEEMEHWGWWETVTIIGHVLAPDPYARNAWARLIGGVLRIPSMRCIAMDDGGPMRVLSVAENYDANPLTEGQITITARVGVRADEAIFSFPNPPIVPGGGLPYQPPPIFPPGTGPGSYGPPVPSEPPVPPGVSAIDTGVELDIATTESYLDGSPNPVEETDAPPAP